jgi:hypothetical protein
LIDKIPDISNQETDDLNTIEYDSQDQTMNICIDATQRLRLLNNSDGLINSSSDNGDDSISYAETESDKIPTLNEQPPNYFESETVYWMTKKQTAIKPSAPALKNIN